MTQPIYIQCPCCGATIYVKNSNLFGSIAQMPYANYSDFLSKTQCMNLTSYQNMINAQTSMSFYDQMCNSIRNDNNEL